MKPFEIFRAGKHTASDGRAFTFTQAMLQQIADGYDPKLHEAPFVVGHPKSDGPAYGWGKALQVSGDRLLCVPAQVEPQFQELVEAGRFKKRSAAFYGPEDPANPKPGAFYIRHIGFLGATPPALKGLRDVEFSGDASAAIEFMDWTTRDIASIFRGIRDFLIGKYGQEDADKAIPSYLIDNIQTDAVTEPAPAPSFQETNDVDKAQLEAQKREQDEKARLQAAKDIEFAEREKKIKADEAAARRTAIVAEVDELVKAGKLLPKDKAGLVAFMETLPADTKIEFGEGDKKIATPGIDWLRGFLKTLPKAVEFKERGAGDAQDEPSADPLVQAGLLSRMALEFQETEKKAGRTVDIATAVAHVTAQQSA